MLREDKLYGNYYAERRTDSSLHAASFRMTNRTFYTFYRKHHLLN
ncbi:hypothetical protein J3D55_003537 [Chryseobacterium ginsenosidimutans]|nr:hypothetical protein [Chryseobacterium ginsenosidimutans]MCS3870621.1 hypothetical protein [Chryseobacterium ginsenosidimutans]